MTDCQWPFENGVLGGSWTWPERGQVILVLDGIAIDDLPLKIHQWSQSQSEAEGLYTGTPWEPVNNRSPWLVYPEHPGDPVLARFLEEQAVGEAGYLLVSPHDRPTIASAMRCLLHVERVEGVPELLRIGHPAIARSIIGERLLHDAAWPFTALITPDAVAEQWLYQQRTGADQSRPAKERGRVSVDERLLRAFREFDQRQSALAYFRTAGKPVQQWLGEGTRAEQFDRLQTAFSQADQWQFNTPRSRILFLALLQRSATRPWLRESLPTTLLGHLRGAGSVTERLNNALQAVGSSVSSTSTTQG